MNSKYGRFQDLTLIAEGGMGLIFRATDPDIDREIAIKVLRPDFASHQEQIAKFQNELQLTGQLEHPNIVPVHETGCTDDQQIFFCMKLVQGESLSEILEKQHKIAAKLGHSINPTPFLRHLLRICDAISFAHSREIIHRDLKPANIMIGAFGEVLVMDWGIARKIRKHQTPFFQDTSPSLSSSPIDPNETSDGTILGTMAYMSPEQAQGKGAEIDIRTDVYCLGAILYDILTGTPPHMGKNTQELLDRVRVGTLESPGGRITTGKIPTELNAVILKAMAPEKQDRYQNVQAFQDDIRAYLDGRALAAATYSPLQLLSKWVARNRKVCTAVASVATFAITLFSFDRWQEWKTRERNFEQAFVSAQNLQKTIQPIVNQPANHLPHTLNPHSQTEETLEERNQREKAIQIHLTAIRHLERALQIHPDNEAVLRHRIESGRAVGNLALGGRDYLLARAAYERLSDFGLPQEVVTSLLDRVESTRNERLLSRRKRLEFILDDLTQGLSRSERPKGAPLLTDYTFEAVGYRDLQTIQILESNLKDLIDKAQKPGPDAVWTQPERDRATFICRVLGRLDLPQCVDALGKWMTAVSDHDLAIECGVALCNTRRPEAKAFLFAARDRLGGISQTWFRIENYFDRVPEKEGLSPPKTAIEFFSRGGFLASKKEYRRAILAYTQAIKLDPKFPGSYNNRGIARSFLGDLNGAFDDYSKALQFNPSDIYAYNNRAITLQGLGNLEASIADTTRAIQIAPQYAIAYHTRGYSFFLQQKFDAAINDFNRCIQLDPKSSSAYRDRGRVLVTKNKLNAAISDYTQAIQIDPSDAATYDLRGQALLQKGQIDAAIADYTKAIQVQPQYPPPYYHRAEARHDKGQLDEAIEDYTKTIQLNPQDPKAYYNRGLAHQDKNQRKEAIADYTFCIQLQPNFAQAYINRGILYNDQENYDQAVLDYQEGVRLRPDLWNGWYNMGVSQTRKGQHPQALKSFQKALPIAPTSWKKKISKRIQEPQDKR